VPPGTYDVDFQSSSPTLILGAKVRDFNLKAGFYYGDQIVQLNVIWDKEKNVRGEKKRDFR
jgi:hypothetical protein